MKSEKQVEKKKVQNTDSTSTITPFKRGYNWFPFDDDNEKDGVQKNAILTGHTIMYTNVWRRRDVYEWLRKLYTIAEKGSRSPRWNRKVMSECLQRRNKSESDLFWRVRTYSKVSLRVVVHLAPSKRLKFRLTNARWYLLRRTRWKINSEQGSRNKENVSGGHIEEDSCGFEWRSSRRRSWKLSFFTRTRM